MYFEMRGFGAILGTMAVLSVFGVWKIASLVAWIASHLRWE